jgi:hypothetical protein
VEDRVTVFAFPPGFLPASVLFHLRPSNMGGPQSFSGKQQVRASDAGSWIARLTFDIHTEREIREWRGLVAGLEGKLNELTIGVFDDRQAPLVVTGQTTVGGITHSDGSTFSDGTGYSQSDIRVTVAEDAALRATSLSVEIERAGPLQRGHYFSLTGVDARPRLYIVTSTPIVDGDTASFKFRPPLRVAAAAGDAVEFGRPKATMNLADQMSGQLDIAAPWVSRPTLELEESFLGLA